MKYDNVQVVKMANGYLVNCVLRQSQFNPQGQQEDYVFMTFEEVLAFLNPPTLKLAS